MTEKSMEQLVMEAIDQCIHTRCKRCKYGGDISARRENRSCQGRLIADHLRKNGVVIVTRCEDCGHFDACEEVEGVSWTGFCQYGNFHTDEEDFCSRGERRAHG